MASSESDTSAELDACVEFVHRIHSDGRRERFARVIVLDADGRPVRGPRRPTGPLAAFVADAVREDQKLRRVPIDARAEQPRHRR